MKKHFERRSSIHAPIASMLLVIAILAAGPAAAAVAGSVDSAMSRIKPYLMASKQQEIALARSAAPAAISMHATVMVLGAHGYVTAVKGSNGFVCLVTRSWDNVTSVASSRFWNPKISVPKCLNATAARSMLAENLLKTQWAVAGASEAEIGERVKAARAAGKIEVAAAGAMCYMMSKRSWGVGGTPGAWRSHLMFYFPDGNVPNWGANLNGTPVLSAAEDERTTVAFVLVPVWSDGSPAPAM
jgi:hypothetical protein